MDRHSQKPGGLMAFNLDPSGLLGSLNHLEQEVRRRAEQFIGDAVAFAEREIVHQISDVYQAVDTGRLMGSITQATQQQSGDTATYVAIDGLSAVVGTNVSYAVPVHEGYTRTLKGKAVKAAYRAGKREFVSQGTYSRKKNKGGETQLSLHVEGRPFMEAALPAIREHLHQSAEEFFGPLGFKPDPQSE
jgi:hypothetical protein